MDENFIKSHPILNQFTSYLPNESSKNLTTIKNILDTIPENTTSIFVLGGGITLDIGGFVAGLYRLPVTYLATTLLSAVDAAIGGKTGVNFFPYGKNQVGLFYPHCTLYFVPEFLNTLSFNDKIGGVMEAVKQAYLFAECQNDIPLLKKIILNTINSHEFQELVQKNVHYKSHVVQFDPDEKKDIRSSLNFGHTLAHVLEALAEENFIGPISHGVAVGHGLKFLMDFNFIEKKLNFYDFIQECILEYPLILRKEISKEKLMTLLNQDKKKTQLNSCSLSLPKEGLFHFNSSFNPRLKSGDYSKRDWTRPEFLESGNNPDLKDRDFSHLLNMNYDKVTKQFSLTEIANKINEFIYSPQNHLRQDK